MEILNFANAPLTLDQAWAMQYDVAEACLAMLENIDAREHVRAYHKQKAEGAYASSSSTPSVKAVGDTGILDLRGTITKEKNSFSDWDGLGGTSSAEFAAQCDMLAANPLIQKVRVNIDSNGGQVDGCHEAAQSLARLTAIKPTVGYIEDACNSAAMWIGSQCGKLVMNEAAVAGSVGVYTKLRDTSKAKEQRGEKHYLVGTAPRKGLGEDGIPISEEALSSVQSLIDARAVPFFKAVQRGRGLSDTQLKFITDTADVYVGEQAKTVGLVDVIGGREAADALLNDTNWFEKKKAKADKKASAEEENLMSGNTTQPPKELSQEEQEQAHGLFASIKDFFTPKAAASSADVQASIKAMEDAKASDATRNEYIAKLQRERDEAVASASHETVIALSKGKLRPPQVAHAKQVRLACVGNAEALKAFDEMLSEYPKDPILSGEEPPANSNVTDANKEQDKIHADMGKTMASEPDPAFVKATADIIARQTGNGGNN